MVDYAEMNQLLFEGKHKIVKQMTETLEAWLESCEESDAGNDYAEIDSQ